MKGTILNSSYYFKFFIIILLLFFFSSCDGITPTAPIINSFMADDTTIDEGESVNLSWSVTDAASVSISPSIGSVALSGSTSVSPASTTTYTLTATNSAGSTSAVFTITVDKEPTVLVIGDFESYYFIGWTVHYGFAFPALQINEVHSGNCAAHMGDGAGGLYGDGGSTATASIQQTIVIPVGAENPLLTLFYLVDGTDDKGEGYDWMKVFINDAAVLYVWEDSEGWQEFQYELSSYAGTSIDLTISSWTYDNISPVNYYIDDISLTWY